MLLLLSILVYRPFCKYLCPAGTLEGGIPHVLLNPQLRRVAGALFDWKLAVLVVIVFVACTAHIRLRLREARLHSAPAHAATPVS